MESLASELGLRDTLAPFLGKDTCGKFPQIALGPHGLTLNDVSSMLVKVVYVGAFFIFHKQLLQ